LGPRHPRHQLGAGEGWQRAARPPEVRASHRDTPRRAPRPTRAPPTLTPDLITREKKKTGEKVVNRVRSYRALPPPPAPPPPPPPPALHLLHWCAPSRPRAPCEPHLVVSDALPPHRYRLTRRAPQPPRHRAAHLAVAARPPSLSRIAPRHPPSPITHITRASPARILQPNEPRSKSGVGIADVLHIMTIKIHEYLGRNSVENEPLVVGG